MVFNAELSRRQLFLGASAFVALSPFPAMANESAPLRGLGYLEHLKVSADAPYLRPSALHPSYSHAVYVNTALSGDGAQKMWFLARSATGAWELGLHDAEYWAEKGETPHYSWPVSTGRKYPGDSRSGPTPVGVFNVDDRRYRPGWGSPGMYNALYIDLHYSSGRASGVAIHGTLPGNYKKLGRADSHGCVRMHKRNADRVWSLVHPENRRKENSPLWGEIPRYFSSSPEGSTRSGYVRDGSVLLAADGAPLTREGYKMVFVFFRDDV